ncbi:hypothetical protein Tco_1558092, partial [Tanacetum coccineum]
MRLKTNIKPKEATFQVVLDALALTSFYQAFLITADVPTIYMQEFWAIVSVHKSSIKFTINKKKVSLDVDMFREILQICPKIPRQEFKDLPLEQDILSFIRDLGHTEDITYLTDNGQDSSVPCSDPLGFTKIIIDDFMSKDQSVLRRNKMFWHTTRDDTMFTSMRCISRQEYTQVYGDGVDTQSKVPDEQHLETTGADEGTGTIPGVLDVPIYESKSEKESWGDSADEENENDFDDINDEGDDDNDGDDDDANDDDKQEGDDTNNDDEETNNDRTKS